MKNQTFRFAIFVLGALLLAGCHKLQATTRVESNGSGELRMGIGFSAEERANIEKQDNNAQDFCNTSQTPANVKVIEEQRGDETWCITVTPFEELEGLRALYEQRNGIKINRLEISGGMFYYDVDLDTLSEASDFSALTDITWEVVLPGPPVDHNAEQIQENTLTWRPAPKSGIIHMQAQSEAPRPAFGFPSCGGSLIGLSLAFVYLRRRTPKLSL